MREQELEQHLEQAARIGAQLGLRPKDLESGFRATCERLAENKEEFV